jgi:hypothetical protein
MGNLFSILVLAAAVATLTPSAMVGEEEMGSPSGVAAVAGALRQMDSSLAVGDTEGQLY